MQLFIGPSIKLKFINLLATSSKIDGVGHGLIAIRLIEEPIKRNKRK